MDNLKINTDAVINTANKIKLSNTQMRDEFQDLERAIGRLDSAWESPASSIVIRKFYDIKSDFFYERYEVLDNFVKYLFQQIGEGYTDTENTNKSLADAFI